MRANHAALTGRQTLCRAATDNPCLPRSSRGPRLCCERTG